MKLEKWALLAEVISGIAIVATLLVLVYETRQSTNATYAASYDDLAAELVDWRLALVSNPKALADYEAFAGFRSDEPDDYFPSVGGMAADALLLIYERAYFARFYGRLGDVEWERYESSICSPFGQRIYAALVDLRRTYTSEFSRYIENCSGDE